MLLLELELLVELVEDVGLVKHFAHILFDLADVLRVDAIELYIRGEVWLNQLVEGQVLTLSLLLHRYIL